MKLRFTPEALNDLAEIKQYIRKNLESPIAAGKIISGILASCSLLKKTAQARYGTFKTD